MGARRLPRVAAGGQIQTVNLAVLAVGRVRQEMTAWKLEPHVMGRDVAHERQIRSIRLYFCEFVDCAANPGPIDEVFSGVHSGQFRRRLEISWRAMWRKAAGIESSPARNLFSML